jgi:hypothetical protein
VFWVTIKDNFFKFLGILVATSMIIYVLSPINFVSGVGYDTWRNIDLSSSAPGFAPTTISTAISTTGQTSVTVNSSANYPSVPFVVTIGTAGTEAIEVTAINGLTWTLVRGYGGTTATTYSSGAAVSGPVTYSVSFVPATPATAIQAIVIDFCSDSPIYNSSTCFTPTGMMIGASTETAEAVGSETGISTALFTSCISHNALGTRDDLICSNSGTGYTPLTPTTISATTPITSTGQTSFTVTSSANYPVATTNNPSSWFYINVTNGTTETMQVTNVSGLVWTVNRAQLGTTALSSAPSTTPISQPPIQFNFYGVMNPTSTGPLYARIYTYNTYSNANTFASATASAGVLSSTYATSNAGNQNIDAGGVALYITSPLVITAKVQEYLQFCVYSNTTATALPCSLTGSTVTLGNSGGILSISSAYVDSSTRFDIATNASGYAAVTFTGAPLSNGALIIENSSSSGTGTVAANAYTSTTGTDQFGLCAIAAGVSYQATNYNSTNLSFPNTTYNSASCPTALATSAVYSSGASFGLNIAQAGSVYGDLLAIQKPGQGSTGLISFLGNVAASQLAGIYSTTFNFVATGTY